MLTREQILAAQDIVAEVIPVPEWGGDVRVRMMSGKQRDAYDRQQYDQYKIGEAGLNMRARLVAACVVDEAGAALFTAEDVEQLGDKSIAALERVLRVARRLNKLEDSDIEEGAKNSAPSPADSSP